MKRSTNNNYTEERPWGTYENLLESDICKVKKIVVKPRQRLSYQYHYKRSEHWIIISGKAEVILDDKEVHLLSGEYIHIPVGSKHRIRNPEEKGDLIFIEVQSGEYFGEDDIVRISDDYNRVL